MTRYVRGLNQYGELEFEDDGLGPAMPPAPPVAGFGGALMPVTWLHKAASAIGIVGGAGLLLYVVTTLFN